MNNFRGNKDDILVNDFGDPHQFNTWRHVTIFNTGSNYAEVGWVDRESAQNGAHPFKTWRSNTQVGSLTFQNVNISRGNRHEFKVHDSDGNNYWSFAWDGNGLGNQNLAALDNGIPIAASEAQCTEDSMFAEFRNLERCHGQNCSFTPWQELRFWKDSSPSYELCLWSSNTAFNVKLVCG